MPWTKIESFKNNVYSDDNNNKNKGTGLGNTGIKEERGYMLHYLDACKKRVYKTHWYTYMKESM